MQSITLPLESWLLCRATRASDNSLAGPVVDSPVQRRGKLNVRFAHFSHSTRPGWGHSAGRDVHVPPLTPTCSLALGKSPSCSLTPRNHGCRRHKGDEVSLCAALQPPWTSTPWERMSRWKGTGMGQRSRWSWAGWWLLAVGQQSLRWDTGRWTAGGERDGDSSCGLKGGTSQLLTSWLTRAAVRGSAGAVHCWQL